MQWYQEKKSKVQGPKVKTHGFNPEILLYQAGYILLPNGSFMLQFDETHRFHAYVIDQNVIELHTDLFKHHWNGRTYHVASTYRCKAERKRIHKILQDNLPEPVAKSSKKSLKRMLREERRLLGLHDEMLPRDKMLEALKNL